MTSTSAMTDLSTTLPVNGSVCRPYARREVLRRRTTRRRRDGRGVSRAASARWTVPSRSSFCINDLSEDEAARLRFQTEARAAVHLRHPNAVSVTDFGQTSEGCVYIVMELLEGRTLREILSREAPIETARAISIMLQASDAVAAAHEAGIIHRDLKPSNILVTQSADQPAVVKVLDFGIAKFFAATTMKTATTLAQTQFSHRHAALHVAGAIQRARVDAGDRCLQSWRDSL